MRPEKYKISQGVDLSKIELSQNQSGKGNGQVLLHVFSAPVSSQIISNFVSDIVVRGDTIWFATGKGLARTTNSGASFQNYYSTDPFGNDDVAGIAVYNNWVVVSTAYSQTINGNDVPTGSGIKVSSDFGVTWNSYPQPTDGRYDTSVTYGSSHIYALPITVKEDNLSYSVLITRKNLSSDSLIFWIASWAGEVRKSIDYGATFQRVVLPPDNLDSININGGPYTFQLNPRDPPQGNNNHKGFSLAAENDSTIYAGTAGGINKSTDWGLSWRKYTYENTGHSHGISGNFVVKLGVQKYSFKTVIWGASNPTGSSGDFSGLSFTSNGGTTWGNTLSEGNFSHNFGFKDSTIYAATDNGIWRSYYTPPGFTWSSPSIIYDETIKDQIRTNLFYSANSQGDSVWVGSGDGLARTVDSTFSPWAGKWKIFRAFRSLAATTDTYAAPNPFSPNQEATRIFFKTGKTSASITIRIFDFGMNLVRTLLQNASRTEPNELWTAWDGKRDDGMQVANGVYFYRIEIDKDTPVWGKILVLQ